MKKALGLALGLFLLLVSVCALADADKFCDEMPEDVRAIVGQFHPEGEMIDCILLNDTPIGDCCLALYPRDILGFTREDGAWTLAAQVSPMSRNTDMRLFFRRHEAGAAPDMQGACGLAYPDSLGFDLIQTNPGYHNSLVAMLQFHFLEGDLRLIGWQKGTAGQLAFWEDGLWTYFDSETGARLGGVRISSLTEYGLMADSETLPYTLEEARKMEAVTREAAETLFPGWTMQYYGAADMGHTARVFYYRVDDGMLTIRRVRLRSDAGGIASQTDTMPVTLSAALLARLQTEDADTLLDVRDGVATFLTDDAFDLTAIPVTGAVLQNQLMSHGLVLLTQDANGVRRLRLVERDGEGYMVRSTEPLPEDATLDVFHSGEGSVILNWDNQHTQCGFTRTADGNWTLGGIYNFNEDIALYGTIYCGVQQYAIASTTAGVLVGSHPWRDLFAIDFSQLPLSTEEAAAGLDRDGWAAVNNPDPADPLLLRAAPDSAAETTGSFYNRTPLQVLDSRGGWTLVRIGLDGRLEGWMPTDSLAFGGAMDAVKLPYRELTLGEAYRNNALFASPQMGETTGVLFGMDSWIVGTAGDGLYIVLDSRGNTGYLPQSWFAPGNG